MAYQSECHFLKLNCSFILLKMPLSLKKSILVRPKIRRKGDSSEKATKNQLNLDTNGIKKFDFFSKKTDYSFTIYRDAVENCLFFCQFFLDIITFRKTVLNPPLNCELKIFERYFESQIFNFEA